MTPPRTLQAFILPKFWASSLETVAIESRISDKNSIPWRISFLDGVLAVTEERAFELLESVGEPVVYRSPNYLRLVQAYRSYVEEGGTADECALRLREITRPGLQRFHSPSTGSLPEAGLDAAGRINGCVDEMVRALIQGDRAGLTRYFEEASDGFRELCQLATTTG